jgi:hyperosmotically inducible periplasmic protein
VGKAAIVGNKRLRSLFRRWADSGPAKPPVKQEIQIMVRRERATMLSAAIAATVLLMSGCAPIQGRETAGEYVDDATVSTKVRAELIGNQSMKGLDIHVETMQDVVQLSGFVDSADQKAQAEQIARGVKGVRGVRNDIVVRTG